MVAVLWALLWLILGLVLIAAFGFFMFGTTAVLRSIKDNPPVLFAHLGMLVLAAFFFWAGEALWGTGTVAAWLGGTLYLNWELMAKGPGDKAGDR